MNRFTRRGAALLEVLVALALTATVGLAVLELARHGTTSVRELSLREGELRVASEMLRRAEVGLRGGKWATDLRIVRQGLELVVVPAGPGLWKLTVVDQISRREVVSTRMRGRYN